MLRGISLNKNAVNIQLTSQQQQQSVATGNLIDISSNKPGLLHQLQPAQHKTNENDYFMSFKPQATEGGGRSKSPGEPSPPKLRSSMRGNFGPQKLSDENAVLIQLDDIPELEPQDKQQQQLKQKPQPVKLRSFGEKILPFNEVKQEQPPPAPQQESIISRIPRLSLKFPSALQQRNCNVGAPTTKTARITSTVSLAAMEHVKELVKEMAEDEQTEDQSSDEEIEDIDKSITRDAIYQVSDIAKDIYEYMYILEEAQSIKQDYLKDQKIFTPKVRQRLVNWCIEINSQLKLLPETLYMTIAVIDRYFEKVPVKQQSQVQLVAVGATMIASKYEEIYPPEVGDLMHLTQNSYSRREIMRIEIHILEQLNFDLGKPIPLAFLRRFSKAAHCDLKMHSIAKYFMELSLTEYECSHWRPSMLAAAALFTTIHLVHPEQSSSSLLSSGSILTRRLASSQPSAGTVDRWNKALVHYTHYTRKQLQEPASILCKILKRAQKNPQSYTCVKKNLPNLTKWPELKSTRVDELIKLGGHISATHY